MIVDTDLGRDPDDFLVICYLAAAGAAIDMISVSPGDPDQIAVAKFLCKELGLDIPVGAARPDRNKRSSGGAHYEILDRRGAPRTASHDGPAHELMESVAGEDAEIFVCGPLTATGKFIERGGRIARATLQGGFLPYCANPYDVPRLDKFEGKTHVPTFNLNGDKTGAIAFMEANIPERRLVGKHICHTVSATPGSICARTDSPGGSLFMEMLEIIWAKGKEKKLHDPTAAVCHLHPDVAHWVRGKAEKQGGGWTTRVCEEPGGSLVAATVDRERFWRELENPRTA